MYKTLFLLPLFLLGSCTLGQKETRPLTQTQITPIHTGVKENLKKELVLEDIGSVNNGQAETGSLLFYADYPIYSGSHVSEYIRAWLQSEVDIATEEAKGNPDYMPDLRPEFMASFTLHTGAITVITYDVGKYIGGAHGSETVKSFPLDRYGNRVLFGDLFIDYEKNREIIHKSMVDSAQKMPGTWDTGETIGSTVSDGVDEFLKDPNFYFSGSHLILMYQKYQIGPGASGPIEVVFPRGDLIKKDILGSGKYEALPEKETKSLSGGVSIDWKVIDEALASEGEKYIALTFDDGPSKVNTPILLDVLKRHGAKATFYVLGKNVSYFPKIAKRTVDEGHEIGSHSWDHPQLTRLSATDLTSQRSRTDAAIKQATGIYPVTFRPPYGAYNAQVKSIFARPLILWSVDTLDWKHRSVSKNISIATSQARDGAIILFHDIHASSVASIESIMKNLEAKSYTFVTVSELLEKNGIKNTGTKVCTNGKSCK